MGTYDEIYRVIDGLFLDKKEHSIQEIRTLCEQQGILLSDRNAVNNVVHKLKVRNRLEPGSEKSFYRIPEQEPDQEPQEGGQKPAKRTAFSGIQTGEKADGIDWNRFFVLEPQSRQALEKRFTINQKGEIRFNSNLTKAVSSHFHWICTIIALGEENSSSFWKFSCSLIKTTAAPPEISDYRT